MGHTDGPEEELAVVVLGADVIVVGASVVGCTGGTGATVVEVTIDVTDV